MGKGGQKSSTAKSAQKEDKRDAENLAKQAAKHVKEMAAKEAEIAALRREMQQSRPVSDTGSAVGAPAAVAAVADAAAPAASPPAAPRTQDAAAARAPAPAAGKKILSRPAQVPIAAGAPAAAAAPPSLDAFFFNTRQAPVVPKSSFKDGVKLTIELQKMLKLEGIAVIPWLSPESFESAEKSLSSHAWAVTLDERYEDHGAALRNADYQVRRAAEHSHRILFVRRPDDHPLAIFVQMDMANRDPKYGLRVETYFTDPTAKATSNWTSAERFFRIQGSKAAVDAASVGVQCVPVKQHIFKDTGIVFADIVVTPDQLVVAREQDVMLYPHAALLASNALDRTATVKFRYDATTKQPTSLGDVWAVASALRALDMAVCLRRGSLRVVAPKKWTLAMVRVVEALPNVAKVITDQRPADVIVVRSDSTPDADGAQPAAQVPSGIAKNTVLRILSTCNTTLSAFKDVIARTGLAAKPVGNVTFTSMMVALTKEVGDDEFAKFTTAAGTVADSASSTSHAPQASIDSSAADAAAPVVVVSPSQSEVLSSSSLIAIVAKLRLSDKVHVHWSQHGLSHKWEGIVATTTRNKQSVTIDYGDEGAFPLPPSDKTVLIHRVDVLSDALPGLPPSLTWYSPTPTAVPPVILWADGACTMSTGVSASAIFVTYSAGDRPPEKHAKFNPASTNNIMEFIALIAAFKWVKKNRIPSVIIMDSELVLKQFREESRSISPHLQELRRQACSLYTEVCNFVSLAHIYTAKVHSANKADAVANECKASAQDIGDSSLFIEHAPVLPKRNFRSKIVRPANLDLTNVDFPIINALEDFVKLRQFKSRSRCPASCQQVWATLVREALTAVTSATDKPSRDKAMINFLVLPTVFLPVNASTVRVETHIASGRPFRLNGDRTDAARSQDTRSRLSKAVTRLAADRKIKAAVKLLQQEGDAEDVPFEEKVAHLRTKFISRQADIAPSTTLHSTSPFSGKSVENAIRKMSRNAATCIDGWSKDLYTQAMSFDTTIADSLGVVCQLVNDGCFGQLVMDIIRAGRLVGIPKRGGGVRPIVVSSSISKLTGSLVLHRAKVKVSEMQFAINSPDGAVKIVHHARQHFRNGKVILRFDSSNAFNIAQRAKIRDLLTDQHPDVLRYFMTIYSPVSQLYVYGPDRKLASIESAEGVRQGDAFSAFFFCLLMDKVCADVKAMHRDADVYAYMDDLTVCTSKDDADEVARNCIATMRRHGFLPNAEKSACVCDDLAFRSDVLPTLSPRESFDMLGANVTSQYEAYNAEQAKRVHNFFNVFEKCELHPQLQWTILRLCGFPKLRFYASVTPPEFSRELLAEFQQCVTRMAEKIIDSPIRPELLHDVHGAGFPDYLTHADALYTTSRDSALLNAKVPEVRLVTNESSTASLRAQYNGHYLFYSRQTPASIIPDHIFRAALAIRLRTIPKSAGIFPKTCRCGTTCHNAEQVIDHTLLCDQMTHYTHTCRHNDVRDAIAQVVRSYGISVTSEPKFYSGFYEGPAEQRPDLTFHTMPKISTDLTIVASSATVGEAANKAAARKIATHAEATAQLGHIFMPFALEVHGHLDKCCYDLMKTIRNYVPDHLHRDFTFDFLHSISTSLASARAIAVLIAMSRRSS